MHSFIRSSKFCKECLVKTEVRLEAAHLNTVFLAPRAGWEAIWTLERVLKKAESESAARGATPCNEPFAPYQDWVSSPSTCTRMLNKYHSCSQYIPSSSICKKNIRLLSACTRGASIYWISLKSNRGRKYLIKKKQHRGLFIRLWSRAISFAYTTLTSGLRESMLLLNFWRLIHTLNCKPTLQPVELITV